LQMSDGGAFGLEWIPSSTEGRPTKKNGGRLYERDIS
jgi:hypothetical protein